MAGGPNRNREINAPLAQVDRADLPSFGGVGQQFGEQQVPHQQLQQDGYVAENLDISRAQTAHQRIARKPAHAHQRAQQRGEDDAQQRHAQRVGQAHQKGAPVFFVGIKSKQAFADVKAGGLQQEVKAALDAAGTHIDQRVVRQIPQRQRNQAQGQCLVDQAAKGLAAPGPLFFRGGRRCHGKALRGRLAGAADTNKQCKSKQSQKRGRPLEKTACKAVPGRRFYSARGRSLV